MIRIFTLSLVFSFLITSSYGQAVPKQIVVEQFSNTRCSVCASRIPQLRQNMAPYQDNIQLISFFSAAPYPNCELYQANTSGNNARVNYYNVTGSPQVYVNGTRVNSGNDLVPQSYFEERVEDRSNVEVTTTFDKAGLTASATVTYHNEIPQGEIVINTYLVEKNVVAGTLPGYTQHHHVFREHLTAAAGDPVSIGAVDGSQTFNFTIGTEWAGKVNDILIVSVVQNKATKEVYNAGNSDQASTAVNEAVALEIEIFPNPVSETLNIKMDKSSCGNMQVVIYNELGKPVKMVNDSEWSTGRVNVAELSAGNYILQGQSDGCRWAKKFIVIK